MKIKCTSNKANNEFYYDLGLAYHYALKFDEAIGAYTKFIELNPKKMIPKIANVFILNGFYVYKLHSVPSEFYRLNSILFESNEQLPLFLITAF